MSTLCECLGLVAVSVSVFHRLKPITKLPYLQTDRHKPKQEKEKEKQREMKVKPYHLSQYT